MGGVFQLSRQLVYEKSKLEEERRNFMMAEQQWNGVRQALELEIEASTSSIARFDSDASQIEFCVNSVKGSIDQEEKGQVWSTSCFAYIP